MLWEKPDEKETRATGYTVQERYRSRWLSPISRYNHLCAGDTRESGSHHRLRSPQVSTDPEMEARQGEAQGHPGSGRCPNAGRTRTPDPHPSVATTH